MRRQKKDPTAQAGHRKRSTIKFNRRLNAAKKDIVALFKAIPVTYSRDVVVVNETIPVYDYQITTTELAALNQSIASIVRAELLDTQYDRIDPNWWWKEPLEVSYRGGTAREINDFNRLITDELIKIRMAEGIVTHRLELNNVALSSQYQAALNAVYIENHNHIKTLSERTASQVINKINTGIAAKNAPADVISEINERFGVAKTSAKRIVDTELNKAFNNAKMNANDIASEQTGLRAGVIHLSALIPTTRDEHAGRHGNAYTTAQQRKWWDSGTNRINCHCSTKSVLIDKNGKVIDTEFQEEIQAEKSFFDKG